jgi:hypothetical protein
MNSSSAESRPKLNLILGCQVVVCLDWDLVLNFEDLRFKILTPTQPQTQHFIWFGKELDAPIIL